MYPQICMYVLSKRSNSLVPLCSNIGEPQTSESLASPACLFLHFLHFTYFRQQGQSFLPLQTVSQCSSSRCHCVIADPLYELMSGLSKLSLLFQILPCVPCILPIATKLIFKHTSNQVLFTSSDYLSPAKFDQISLPRLSLHDSFIHPLIPFCSFSNCLLLHTYHILTTVTGPEDRSLIQPTCQWGRQSKNKGI